MTTLWAALASILVALLKGVFGTDKPHETEVVIPEPEVDLSTTSDSELLDECGL